MLLLKQLTPRKGTVTRHGIRDSPYPWKQPTPRKGTETAELVQRIFVYHKKQLTPRKGTVTRSQGNAQTP